MTIHPGNKRIAHDMAYSSHQTRLASTFPYYWSRHMGRPPQYSFQINVSNPYNRYICFTKSLILVFICLSLFSNARANSPVWSEGSAEICFTSGSSSLTNSAKITLIRLIYSARLYQEQLSINTIRIKAFGDASSKSGRQASLQLAEQRAIKIREFLIQQNIGSPSISHSVFASEASEISSWGHHLFEIYLFDIGTQSQCWNKSDKRTPAIVQISTGGCICDQSAPQCHQRAHCNEHGCQCK